MVHHLLLDSQVHPSLPLEMTNTTILSFLSLPCVRQIALLTSKKRQASVKAGSDLKLLSLDRGTFKRVLGPIEDILQRNMSTYNKVRLG